MSAVQMVRLELNNSGAWKLVGKFNGLDPVCMDSAKTAVALMACAIEGNSWRIVTDTAVPGVLHRYETKKGWVEA